MKTVEYEDDSDTDCNRSAWNDLQRFGEGNGKVENKRTNRNHPQCSIAGISQNTEKCPGDRMRLAVPQTPVKEYKLRRGKKTQEY